MPGPSGIIEHATSQRDEIRIPRADNRFGLFETGDESDGDNRDTDGGLDGPHQPGRRGEPGSRPAVNGGSTAAARKPAEAG